MSRRNTLEVKRQRRVRRSLVKGRLPAYVDLVQWIKLRSNVTTPTAVRLILAGVLRVDSCVPADVARRIHIVVPNEIENDTA